MVTLAAMYRRMILHCRDVDATHKPTERPNNKL